MRDWKSLIPFFLVADKHSALLASVVEGYRAAAATVRGRQRPFRFDLIMLAKESGPLRFSEVANRLALSLDTEAGTASSIGRDARMPDHF
jgi:hypothetical protein